MQHIKLETEVAAPVERCFLLSLSIDLHEDAAAHTRERAVAGVTGGIIGAGERVTWRGRHFGLLLTHESVISGYDRPRYFQDSMLRGAFHSFVHDHYFEAAEGGTLMRDELGFEAPWGVLGRIAESLVLRSHLVEFLQERNQAIKAVAEAEPAVWRAYLR